MRCFTERRVRCSSSDRGTYTTGGLSKSYFPWYHNDHGGYVRRYGLFGCHNTRGELGRGGSSRHTEL